MQNSKPSIQKITAFHEAAHVVLAVAHEMAVGDVSIVADHTRGSHGTAVVWDPLLGWKRGDGGRRELVDM